MVYLLHGFIGSGKTTKARELEQALPAIRFTPDEWMARLFGFDPPANTFNANLEAIFELARPLWLGIAKAGGNVILDFGFWTRSSRQEMTDLLEAEKIPFQWVVMETSLEDCRNRNRRRRESGEGLLAITEATFDLLLGQFEPFLDEKGGCEFCHPLHLQFMQSTRAKTDQI